MRARLERIWTQELAHVAPRLAGTLGTSGASVALGVVSGTVAARVLGPSARGDLAQLLLWPQLIVTLGILGVELACTYFSTDAQRRGRMPATALSIAALQSVVLVAVYLAVVPFVFAPSIRTEALMMTPLIPLYLVGACSIACLSGRMRFGAFNVVRITLPILYSGAIVALAAAGALSPATAAGAYLAAHALSDLLALFLVWRESGLGRFDRGLAREAVAYGARAHFGRMAPQSLGLDLVIISLMLSSRDVGLYAAAAAFLSLPNLVAYSVGLVVFPSVSATHRAGARPEITATFALHAAAIVCISAALIVAAEPAVTLLFGSEYAGGVTALRFLAVAALATSLRSFPLEVLRGVGRPGLTSIAEAANWLLFIAALPVGAVAYGLAGAAAAIAVAACASLAVTCALIWRTGVAARPNVVRAPATVEAMP